jgi:hypothetical protein
VIGGTALRPRPQSRRRLDGWFGPDSLATALVLGGTATAILVQLRATPLVPGSGLSTLLGHGLAAVLLFSGVLLAKDGALSPWPTLALPGRGGPTTIGQVAARAAEARDEAKPRPIRWPVLGVSAVLGVMTFLLAGGNRFTPLNVTTWALSVVTFVAATWVSSTRESQRFSWVAMLASLPHALGLASDRRNKVGTALVVPWIAVAVVTLCIAGTAVLYWRIADVPREMTSDHAEKLLDAQDVLDGTYRIFFPRNTGREALQFYLIAAMSPLTGGLSYLLMKLGTAAIAVFTLPFTFLLGRLLGGTGVGLSALALEVCMRWLLQVARVGLRFPFPPAFGSAIAYFMFRALRDRRRNDFIVLGIVIGISQHTYTALRLFPLGVAACIGIAWVFDRRTPERSEAARRLLVDAVLMVGVAFLIFMPLARYAFEDPQMFLFRGVSRIASDRVDEVPNHAFSIFLSNVVQALLFFNWSGDPVWVNTIPRVPILDPVSGGLLVMGTVWCVYRLIGHREARYGYLAILFFAGMLPSVASIAYPGENPSTVRMGAVIPLVAVVTAVGLVVATRRLASWLEIDANPDAPIRKGASVAIAAAFSMGLVGWAWSLNARAYFVDYPAQHAAASQHASRFGDIVRGFVAEGGRRDDVHILPGPHWVDWRLVAIEGGDVRWQPIVEKVTDIPAHDGAMGRRLYIVHPEDRASLDQLRRWYPTATVFSPGFPETGGSPLFVGVDIPAATKARLP